MGTVPVMPGGTFSKGAVLRGAPPYKGICVRWAIPLRCWSRGSFLSPEGHSGCGRQENQRLRQRLAEREGRRARVAPFGSGRQAEFASTAQVEGVRWPVARRLRAVPLRGDTPAGATLGRRTRAAARRATALLGVLGAARRPRTGQIAADEIFFGRKACQRAVGRHSPCRLSGRRADRRTAAEGTQEFGQRPRLRQTTRDGGRALAKGLRPVNQQRQQKGQGELPAVTSSPASPGARTRRGRRGCRRRRRRRRAGPRSCPWPGRCRRR